MCCCSRNCGERFNAQFVPFAGNSANAGRSSGSYSRKLCGAEPSATFVLPSSPHQGQGVFSKRSGAARASQNFRMSWLRTSSIRCTVSRSLESVSILRKKPSRSSWRIIGKRNSLRCSMGRGGTILLPNSVTSMQSLIRS